MIQLTRQIRFSLVSRDQFESQTAGTIANSWAGWPISNGTITPFLELQCTIAGKVVPETGYVCNVKDVDHLLREYVVAEWITNDKLPRNDPLELTQFAWRTCKSRMPGQTALKRITLKLNPYLRYSIDSQDETMVQISQQFEFSASHRLHCKELSDEENRKLFGKCNNPNGHGHNYVLDLKFKRKLDQFDLAEIESTVKKQVIDPFDHKYLNKEVEEFESLNPSVENIAISIWNRLEGKFKFADLTRVRVYETPKTWADYSGD